jgi:putative DNA primase/helicase
MVEAAAAPAAGVDYADIEDDDAIVASIAGAEPKVKLPHGFRLKPDGLWFQPEGEDTFPFRVCGSLDVLAQTRDDAGASWGLLLEWRDDDGRPHRWAMPKALLAGDGGEIRSNLLDKGCYVSPTAKGRSKLMDYLATVTIDARARAVDQSGWTDGAFALPDRTIGDTPAHRVIYQGAGAFDHAYRSIGTLEEWQRNVARYGIGNSRLALALSAAFVGPLLSLLGEEGGGINLRGPSSIGKSTALVAAGSVWGSPSFVRQWRATSNGLEGVAVQHNETLLCLDELAQLDAKEAGSVAYMLANGMGKARAGRSGALRSPAQWKVMFLSSGEISLGDLAGRDGRGARRSAAGQEVRILDVEADAGAGLGLFEIIHDAPSSETLARRIKEGAGSAYGIAGPLFLERIVERVDSIAPALKKGMEDFVRTNLPADATGQVARGARRFGLIAVAGEIAARVGILPWAPGNATEAAATVFRQWLVGRGGSGSSEDRQAIERVRGFLEQHGSSRFEPIVADEYTPKTINRAGFWREGEAGREYLILGTQWREEVCAGMDASRVARVLAEAGYMRRGGDGKSSLTVTLPGGIGKTRCYVITNAIFGEGSDA